MKTLLIYATNSGNTYYTALRIAEMLKSYGFFVDVRSAGDVVLDILDSYDTIILGSCTWNRHAATAKYEDGQLQDQMQRLVERSRGETFANKTFAIFGLGDSAYEHFCAAADHLEKFVALVKGKKVGDTLRIDSFPQPQEAIIDAWARSLVPLLK